MKAVGGGGGGGGRRLAADDSVDGGGRQQQGASSLVVVGSGKAIVGGQGQWLDESWWEAELFTNKIVGALR
jgi:hypothetical protein